MAPITASQLVRILPGAARLADQFVPALNRAFTRHGIDSPQRASAFIAQIGHESAQLTRLVENLNYSAQGLANTWPTRYRGADGKPNTLAQRLARKPEAIANNAYASRMGNGDEASGDGWRFRGRGAIQTTGRHNYAATGRALGLDLLAQPELLEQPDHAIASAAHYWSVNGLNELADAGRFGDITKRINGGMHGHADRLAIRDRALAVLS